MRTVKLWLTIHQVGLGLLDRCGDFVLIHTRGAIDFRSSVGFVRSHSKWAL